jgi:hypothetical protein
MDAMQGESVEAMLPRALRLRRDVPTVPPLQGHGRRHGLSRNTHRGCAPALGFQKEFRNCHTVSTTTRF